MRGGRHATLSYLRWPFSFSFSFSFPFRIERGRLRFERNACLLWFVVLCLLAISLRFWALSTPNHKASVHFTHVIAPFSAKKGSEHDIAQTLMLRYLHRAVQIASISNIVVEVMICIFEEDSKLVEDDLFKFEHTKIVTLSRSTLDLNIDNAKKLPFVSELLESAFNNAEGMYIVLTNMDINLRSDFYVTLMNTVDFDQPFSLPHSADDILARSDAIKALDITRFDLPLDELPPLSDIVRVNNPSSLAEIEAKVQTLGLKHPGHDCFVLPMAWIKQQIVPKNLLGNLFLGYPRWGRYLLCLMRLQFSFPNPNNGRKTSQFKLWRESGLTFHFGSHKNWKIENADNEEMTAMNEKEVMKLLETHYPSLLGNAEEKSLSYTFSYLC